jgi:hypothetical protein
MRYSLLVAFAFGGLSACGEVIAPGHSGTGPTILSITPERGSILGGTEVTLTGSGLSSGEAGVVVDGVLAPSLTVASDTMLVFTTPSGQQEGALVDVTVFNGSGHATLPRSFRYNEAPIVISISPSRGHGGGGTPVTIVGRGFQKLEAGATTVEIDGVPATDVVVVDDTTITATTAAAPESPPFEFVDVTVSNVNGSSTLSDQFQVTQPGLIAFSGNNVHYVDVRTGKTTQLVRLDRNVRKCVLGPQGTLLGSAKTGTARELVSFDPFATTVTTLGAFTNTRSVAGMAAVGGALFGVTTDNVVNCCQPHTNNIVGVNTTNGSLTVIGAVLSLGTGSGQGLAIAPRDQNSVYLLRSLTGTLDSIDTTTGVRTAGGAMTGGPNSPAKAAAVVGDSIYVVDRNSNQLWSLNPTTRAFERVVTQPLANMSAICGTPASF